MKTWLIVGASLAGLAVLLGAFGAHALKTRVLSEDLAIFETGVRYHMFHALALIFSGWVFIQWQAKIFLKAALAFVGGILFFSGSLYLLVLAEFRWLGAVTPIGGLCFIAGWACWHWVFFGFRNLPQIISVILS